MRLNWQEVNRRASSCLGVRSFQDIYALAGAQKENFGKLVLLAQENDIQKASPKVVSIFGLHSPVEDHGGD